jgi:effector-binding domain-containing protein
LDPTGNRIIPSGKYLTAFFRGYYGEPGDLSDRVETYLKEHKLKARGPVFTLYLLDEICLADTTQYLGQIRVAVSPTG